MMLTIDAQVHVYERNHAGRPWLNETDGPPEVTGEDMITAMDAVGVDGALLVSQNSRYGFESDNSTYPGSPSFRKKGSPFRGI